MWSYTKLILWGAGWLCLWTIFLIRRKERDNCLTWAVEKWDEQGGYLVIRWCRHNKLTWIKWPHFLWLDSKHEDLLEHVVPKEGVMERQFLPHPWFTPQHIKGDPVDVVEN